MRGVAELDERAPDYAQALGELAAALQRMALLQAVRDLPRDDDDERDALLESLAAKFSPEDLQLCYQIAITSRRDLDYAPDARGGFEMALLRMLAFRPDESAGREPAPVPQRATASSVPRAASIAAPAATVVQSAAEGRIAAPAAVVQPADGRSRSPTSRRRVVGAAGTTATAGARCSNSRRIACSSRRRRTRYGCGSIVRASISGGRSSSRSSPRPCRPHYGRTLRLDIALSDAVEPTPARQQQAASDERLKAAQIAIDSDPAVRAMRDVFGATVQPGSVKPLE